MKKKNRIRKLLFSAAIDLGDRKYAPDTPTVNVYHHKDEYVEVTVKLGFDILYTYGGRNSPNLPLSKLKLLDSKDKIREFIINCVNETFPQYKGNNVVTELYISGHAIEVYYQLFDIINLDNEE